VSDADPIISAIESTHETLAARVATLTDADLARPSACTDWDISQVLSHLGSGAEIAEASLAAALDATPTPGADFNQSTWDRWNAMTRRDRADGYLAANQSLINLYNSIDPATREDIRIDLGYLPEPVDLTVAAGLRLREVALHSWDVHVTFDENATLAADATAAMLHAKPDLIAWIAKPGALAGKHYTINVSTTAPVSDFTLRLRDTVSVDFDVATQPDGTLSLPAEAWLRLLSGRLTPSHTPATVNVEGAADLGLLRQVFPGY
jgi:uncharacterized protein (TIGR03083 family)